ncbi:hypothetical protein PV05_09808 [Exophiala xenobiotica]|uniref:Uncharacterized protein n=1 Tax=Exophiala xenobiotica TaxID=348802 RepID=A0A0D2E6K2_9EURO|nr:uncharacterized protein PV05_09808 [Exophiala xenobiotica]KIW51053.1 hypothetical protein PV05_09808 [Exophiala xenobiotica]
MLRRGRRIRPEILSRPGSESSKNPKSVPTTISQAFRLRQRHPRPPRLLQKALKHSDPMRVMLKRMKLKIMPLLNRLSILDRPSSIGTHKHLLLLSSATSSKRLVMYSTAASLHSQIC